jgi:hydrogenase expression/formation protein HypC
MCLGVPGRIVARSERDGLPMAVVEFGGVRQEACLACVPEAAEGDWVLVHVGFALTVLDEEEAAATLAALQSLGVAGTGDAA